METNEIVKLKKRNRFLVVTALSMTVAWVLFFVYAFVQSAIAQEKEKLAVTISRASLKTSLTLLFWRRERVEVKKTRFLEMPSIQLQKCQEQTQQNEQRTMAAEHEAMKQMVMAQQVMLEAMAVQKKSK